MNAALIALVAALALTSSASAAPRNGKIAFTSDRDYQGRGYVMDPDGRLVTPLTKHGAGVGSWSPDGRRIVLTDLAGVFTVASDGTDRRVVLAARGLMMRSLSLSPDGSRIAFAGGCSTLQPCNVPAPREIQLMNSDGTDIHGISGDPPNSDGATSPSWSPDGTRIAFARFVPPGFTSTANIWLMNADGTGQSMLTPGIDPAWSPDGNWIAFSRLVRMNLDVPVFSIFLVHPDGSGLHRLTSPGHGTDGTPAWSPDSHRLLYVHRVFAGFAGWSEIHVIRPDGSGDRDLTPNSSQNLTPAWQPVTGAAPPGPPVIPTVLGPPTRPRFSVRSPRLHLRVDCRRTRAHCRGTLSLVVGSPFDGKKDEHAGRTRFDVRAGRVGSVDIPLTRSARARLRRLGTGGQEARTILHSRRQDLGAEDLHTRRALTRGRTAVRLRVQRRLGGVGEQLDRALE